MDTYYEGSTMEDEDNILEWTTRGLNIDGNGAFIATLTVSIALMAFLRLASYINLF
ncbi:hypothetical protein SAMN04488587_1133 [Methanococcoides vulcani]|uniref:Uncharacterized protein n=1 Tax=Methanococcoides vulcani TaxID=1353158 RepID=A0A1H9ZH37_9EURY|nr:hypothetical protein [Methanococcoides vulcani]SES81001.1 hypothetical protein SAMN04488587_1133 [Methanococcoides vulcani]